jgi:4'-phosphopantetheinyl transferase EntD
MVFSNYHLVMVTKRRSGSGHWFRYIDRVSTAGMVVSELIGPPPTDALLATEAAALGPAGAAAYRDHAAGRLCARRALAQLDVPHQQLPAGPMGTPIWPEGTVGSITYCVGYAVAVVGSVERFAALGVSAGRISPLPREVTDRITVPAERDWLDRAADAMPGSAVLANVIFSAKKAAYKAWSPLTGRPVGWRDALVRFESGTGHGTGVPVTGHFTVGPAVERLDGRTFSGRFAVADGLVIAAVTVPASDARREAV